MAFLSLQKIADDEGRSIRTLYRQIAAGEGPPLTQLSERRVGVDEEDYRAWKEARRRPQPEPAANQAA